MATLDKLVVVAFFLLVLGGSYVAAIYALASEYLLVATLAYLVVAVVLLARIVTKPETV